MFGPSAAAISASTVTVPVNIHPNPGPTLNTSGSDAASSPTNTSSSPTAATSSSPSAKVSSTTTPADQSSPRKGSIASFFSGLNANGAAGGGFGGGVVPMNGGGLATTQLASPRSSISGPVGGGGGLGSSPNVPRPGTSIDPTTGKPYMAGLTRAELEAMRTKGAGLLDPTPAHMAARRGSAVAEAGRAPSEIGGREQAAAQLLGTGVGSVPSSPVLNQKRGSIVEDLEKNVRQFQQKASSMLPVEVKNLFAEPKGKEPEGSPVRARRGSAAAIFENVKNTASKIASDVSASVKEVIADPPVPEQTGAGRRGSILEEAKHQAVHGRTESALKPETGRAPGTAGADQSLLEQMQEGFSDLAKTAAAAGAGLAGAAQGLINQTARPGEVSVAAPSATAAAPASLPSEEKTGAKPGDFSTGAGALPGKLGEAGVAVPPDVRAQEGTAGGLAAFSQGQGSSSSETESTAPAAIYVPPAAGLLAGGGIAAIASTLLPQAGTTLATSGSDPVLADATPANASTATDSATPTASAAAPIESGLKNPENAKSVSDLIKGPTAGSEGDKPTASDLIPSGGVASTSTGLAPPLPATTLGDGTASGATDLESAGVHVPASTAASSAAVTPGVEGPSTAGVRGPNERATSLTSVTAIRHGQAGDLHEDAPNKVPLSTIDSANTAVAGSSETPLSANGTEGQKSTVRGTGPNHTTSLAPGDESQGVGHPSTREQEGTSRSPGSYPEPDHGSHRASADKEKPTSTNSTPATSTAAASSAAAHPDAAKSTSPSNGGNGHGHHGRSSLDNSSSHNRTGSSASDGGKKVGFMKKLKGEMKVIGGKITHNEEKVELGEKIKAGEA